MNIWVKLRNIPVSYRSLILSPRAPNSASALLRTILDKVHFAAITTTLRAATALHAGAALLPTTVLTPARAEAPQLPKVVWPTYRRRPLCHTGLCPPRHCRCHRLPPDASPRPPPLDVMAPDASLPLTRGDRCSTSGAPLPPTHNCRPGLH
jgi:hypothetical protein